MIKGRDFTYLKPKTHCELFQNSYFFSLKNHLTIHDAFIFINI